MAVAGGGASPIPAGLDAALVLLRHGETTWIAEGRFQGGSDVPLSPLGERQATLAAERIAEPRRSPVLPIPDRPPLEIVHSPLRPDPAFRELSQGRWEGMARAEIQRDQAETLAAWRRTPHLVNAPEGERLVDVAARAREGLARLLDRLAAAPKAERTHGSAGYPPPPAPDTPWTLLVGHDGIFKATLLALLGLPLERFWAFPFGLAGISVVELRDGMPVLRAHNLTEHLAPLLDEVALGETEERQRSGAM